MLPSAVWKMGRQTQPRLITIFSGFLETAFSEDRSWPVPCCEQLPWRGVTPGLGTQHQSCSGCCGCSDCSASFLGCLLTPGMRRAAVAQPVMEERFVPCGWPVVPGAAGLPNALSWPDEGWDSLHPSYQCGGKSPTLKYIFLSFYLPLLPLIHREWIYQCCNIQVCFCMRFLYSYIQS